jgi:RNA polymerase sigma-70 factor (ECF subfamily)
MKLSRSEFERLALQQLDLLYRVARRLTRSTHAAEDLVQETYLRALKAHGEFDLQEYGIRPWLLRIMHNLHVSRAQRERKQPQSIEQEHLNASQPSPGGLPIDPASWDGMDQRLVHALEQLQPEYQVVLLLWAVDELSYKEIAEALNVPIGTVMSRLHRARQRLSDQLRDYASREGLIRE